GARHRPGSGERRRRHRDDAGVDSAGRARSPAVAGSVLQRTGGLLDQVAEEAEDVAEQAGGTVDDDGAGVNGVGAGGEAGEEICDGSHVVVLSSWAVR